MLPWPGYVDIPFGSWCVARWLVLAQGCAVARSPGPQGARAYSAGAWRGQDSRSCGHAAELCRYDLQTCRSADEAGDIGRAQHGRNRHYAGRRECPDSIAALVYLCAFLPRTGDSLATWASQDRESMVNPSTTERRPEGSLAIKPEFISEAFYQGCKEEDIAFARSRLVDQPMAPLLTAVETTPERWGRIPRYYIECVRDKAITLGNQREMQRHSPCRETFTIDTNHSPFLSEPEKLADILVQISNL